MNITTSGIHTLNASWSGGPGQFSISGTFANGSKAVLVFNDGDAWVSFGRDGVFGSSGSARFECATGYSIGLRIIGPETGYNLTVNLASL